VSVSDLDICSSIHIGDIKLPNGGKATSTENLSLVTCVAPSGMQEEEPAPAAEAAAAPAAKAPAAKA